MLNVYLPYDPDNPGYLPQSICPRKDLNMSVHRGFIFKSHKLVAIQTSSNRYMKSKLGCMHTRESYPAIRKIHNHMDV